MPQERLTNHEFLTRLTTLFSSTHSQAHGSVYLAQKPLKPNDEAALSKSPQIIIRATNGDGVPKSRGPGASISKKLKPSDAGKPKIKFATVVDVADLEGFYAKYAEVCKKGMEGLRKRDKKKAKERAKAKKKGKAGS